MTPARYFDNRNPSEMLSYQEDRIVALTARIRELEAKVRRLNELLEMAKAENEHRRAS